jgi:hypothetical protein
MGDRDIAKGCRHASKHLGRQTPLSRHQAECFSRQIASRNSPETYKGLLEQEQSITPNQGEEMNNASTGNKLDTGDYFLPHAMVGSGDFSTMTDLLTRLWEYTLRGPAAALRLSRIIAIPKNHCKSSPPVRVYFVCSCRTASFASSCLPFRNASTIKRKG